LRFIFCNPQQAFPDAILGLDGFTLSTLEVIVPSAYRRDWLINSNPSLVKENDKHLSIVGKSEKFRKEFLQISLQK
jgi:hypothetical protein